MILTTIISTQSSSEKKQLAGSWSVASVSYGDYYYYDMIENKLEVRDKLKQLMLQDPERYGPEFLETLRKNALNYARSYSFTINQNDTYSLTLGTKKVSGKFDYRPLQIPISTNSPISDEQYNEDHGDDFAYLQLSNGEAVSITEYADALGFSYFTNAKKAGDEDFYAVVMFYIKK